MASEAHLQRVLSVKMWRFLVTLIEDIANQLDADFASFVQAIKAMRPSARSPSNQPTRQPSATRLPIFPPDIDPAQLVLQHSPSPYHRFAGARLLPADGLMRLLELFRVDKGPITAAGSYTWDMFLDEYLAADCALGEGEGHKRPGSFTVSGATGSLAALNGSYVIRPTAEEQTTLVAPPDGALAYVGEGIVFERLVAPTDETTPVDTRVVWVAYEPATAQRSAPRLLAVGPGRNGLPFGSFPTHPAVSSPAFETEQFYTVEGAQLVPIDPIYITAALPLDFYVPRSRFDPTTLEVDPILSMPSRASIACAAIGDYLDALPGSDTQPVAYYLLDCVVKRLPRSVYDPEPLFPDLPTCQPVPVSKRPLLVRDGEADIRRGPWGLMRLSDDAARRPFTQWPTIALVSLMGAGGSVDEPFKGGLVAVVRSELTSSTTCMGGCGARPDVGRPAGDMPLVHTVGGTTAEQDLEYLRTTKGVWTCWGDSLDKLVCGNCWNERIWGMTRSLLSSFIADLAERDDDASSADASGAGGDAGLTTRPNTSGIATSSARLLLAASPMSASGIQQGISAASASAAAPSIPLTTQRQQPDTGQADTGPAASSASEAGPVPAKDMSTAMPPSMPPQDTARDETTLCHASSPEAGGDPVGMKEGSKAVPQASSAAMDASGSVSIESAYGNTQYVRDRLTREGPWECGVDLRAVFEELAQKFTDSPFGPVFRLKRIIVRQVLECVQLDQLSEALTNVGSIRPLEETAAILHEEARLIWGSVQYQTLFSHLVWFTIMMVFKVIAAQMEGDGVAFVKAMQDIRRRIQEQGASSTADATLPPLPAAGDNFYDFARQAVATLTQQGPPDYTYVETHLRTLVDAVATADPIRDLLFFFHLAQGPLKSPTQGGTEGESAWHATYRGYFDQCRIVAPTGGRRHGSFAVSGAPVINGTYLLRPTEEEQKTLLWTHPETIAYVGKKMVFERLVYPQADGNMGGLWMAHSPSTADRTRVRIIAFGPFKDDSVSSRNPLLSHPAAANPAFETSEWFAVDQEGHISRLDGVKMTTTLPLTFHVLRSFLDKMSGAMADFDIKVRMWADTAEPLESLYDYYTHYLAEREVSKGAAFPMAFYLDAQVMERLPPSARHKGRLTDAGQSPPGYACVSDAETILVETGNIRLADEYVTKAFTEWPFAAVLALLATGSADSHCTGGLVYVLRAESRTQTCCRCGEPCAGSSGGPVDTIPLTHTLPNDNLMDDAMVESERRYIRAAPAGLCVQSAIGSLMCGPCALDRFESAYPTRPDRTPVDVLGTLSSLLSPPSDAQTVPSPQPNSASSSSTPSRTSPATSSIFRGIFTAKDKTKPTPPKPTPTTPKPKPTSTQPSTPPIAASTVTVDTSSHEGDVEPSREFLAIVKALLLHKRGERDTNQCDATPAREERRAGIGRASAAAVDVIPPVLTFYVPRSALDDSTHKPKVVLVRDMDEPMACESLDDYYTHYLAEREVSNGAAFPMAFYLDAKVMAGERLPLSARHKERLISAAKRGRKRRLVVFGSATPRQYSLTEVGCGCLTST
ncbi:unnamed protein product [Vitrella brassicaformis CCMP3155]|uniref:Uncharacterized protein n=1 Tax=Vitrella brassicaformis (strain CCMP3155) TaxID=1169540 RepID=A0A0G4GF45_VITBC|nr:unnamed protein product [Vitrella brassicaformis CCMP3155]|eukprot:CEM28160.1 unnamed protein product [Vitrella brassicaformis CCMP3155]